MGAENLSPVRSANAPDALTPGGKGPGVLRTTLRLE